MKNKKYINLLALKMFGQQRKCICGNSPRPSPNTCFCLANRTDWWCEDGASRPWIADSGWPLIYIPVKVAQQQPNENAYNWNVSCSQGMVDEITFIRMKLLSLYEDHFLLSGHFLGLVFVSESLVRFNSTLSKYKQWIHTDETRQEWNIAVLFAPLLLLQICIRVYF